MKWCIRVWSKEFEKYFYLTMIWSAHGTVDITSDESSPRVSYDTQEQAQKIIDGWRTDGRDAPFWERAEPFAYNPMGGDE